MSPHIQPQVAGTGARCRSASQPTRSAFESLMESLPLRSRTESCAGGAMFSTTISVPHPSVVTASALNFLNHSDQKSKKVNR